MPTADSCTAAGRPARRRIGPRGAVLLVLLGLVALEFGLHRAGYGRRLSVEVDERLGWHFAPDQSRAGRQEEGRLRTNAQGFRDSDWPAPEAVDDSALIVVALGDSVTYGTHVTQEERWTEVLETALRTRHPGRRVEVLNMAVPGYTLEQMARVYEDVARPYQPNLVVFALVDASAKPMRPVQAGSGFPGRSWIVRTATYDWWRQEVLGERKVRPLADPETEEDRNLGHLERRSRRAPFRRQGKSLWEVGLARLEEIDADLHERGGQLVLLSLPRASYVYGRNARSVAKHFKSWALSRRVHVADPRLRFDSEVRPLLDELDLLDLDPADVWSSKTGRMDASFEHAALSLHRFDDPGHLTIRGHELVAEVLLKSLSRAKLLGHLAR